MKDLIVEVANPAALDMTVQQLGGLVMQDVEGSYFKVNGGYRVRSLNGNTAFLKFAIEKQGYGKVIGEIED